MASRVDKLRSSDSSDHKPEISPRTGKPKRRKASRACINCQRTHLTCDNNRPCEKCVDRGMSDTCRDGVRKKAKYLEDVPEELATSSDYVKYDPRYQSASPLQQHQPRINRNQANVSSTTEQAKAQAQGHPEVMMSPAGYRKLTDPFTGLNGHGSVHNQKPHKKKKNVNFESSSASKEFLAISSLLHDNGPKFASPGLSDNTSPSTAMSDDSRAEESTTTAKAAAAILHSELLNQYSIGAGSGNSLADILESLDTAAATQQESPFSEWNQNDSKPRPISLAISHTGSPHIEPVEFAMQGMNLFSRGAHQQQPQQQQPQIDPAQQLQLYHSESNAHTNAKNRPQSRPYNDLSDSRLPPDWLDQRLATTELQHTAPPDVYRSVTSPFPYTPGFRALSAYLKIRFQPEILTKIAHYMAKYRPSFMACTNSLNEQDLIFMEQCFQRALLEYEKFISYSGTPTVVWRRTCQIASVGKEFCILTGWTKEQLLGTEPGKNCMFIVELMDDTSVLKYFEMFSNAAFGDSQAVTTTECTLRTSSGKLLRTSSLWTLKRDVFGIPMMIIGNFLPILP